MTRRTGAASRQPGVQSAPKRQLAGRRASEPSKPTVDTSGSSTGHRSALYDAMSEREFQKHVVDGLKQRGFIVWVVPNMRMTVAGLPDVIAVHPDRAPLLMWELKTQKGRIRPAQKAALACLMKIPGIDARIVRPSDWPTLSEEV